MIQDYIFIGKIIKCSGKKGKFKVYPLTDFPERFKNLEYVYVYNDKKKDFILDCSGENKFLIKEVKIAGNYIYIIFKNIYEEQTINAECYLCIEEEKRINLSEGMYYYYDLIGCDVYLEGNLVGSVSSIENYGSDDLLVLKKDKKKKIFIPLREQFIDNIDIENKKIYLKYYEGLID
ncbi:MAG: ribosome maturation factor RimM [Ignavibacteria bacterium]|nr:ribosome maturation factor RimM [Ignavibacteria bacterium]